MEGGADARQPTVGSAQGRRADLAELGGRQRHAQPHKRVGRQVRRREHRSAARRHAAAGGAQRGTLCYGGGEELECGVEALPPFEQLVEHHACRKPHDLADPVLVLITVAEATERPESQAREACELRVWIRTGRGVGALARRCGHAALDAPLQRPSLRLRSAFRPRQARSSLQQDTPALEGPRATNRSLARGCHLPHCRPRSPSHCSAP